MELQGKFLRCCFFSAFYFTAVIKEKNHFVDMLCESSRETPEGDFGNCWLCILLAADRKDGDDSCTFDGLCCLQILQNH